MEYIMDIVFNFYSLLIDNYQITKILIFPNQKLDGRYHHLFNDYFYEKDLKFFAFIY